MAQQILGTAVKVLAKAAMKKKAKSSMNKKAAVAAGASNESLGRLDRVPSKVKRDFNKTLRELEAGKTPSYKSRSAKRNEKALKLVNKKPLPKRSRSGKASGR